jgi:hypothetical protein
MKKFYVIKWMAPLSLSLFLCCLSSYRMLSKTSATEAGTLKSYCEQNNIRAPEVTKGDSLFASANVQLQKGKTNDGYRELDLAVLYYRVALSNQELNQSQKRFDEATKQLNEDESELSTYQEVYQGLKDLRKAGQ